MKGFGIYVKNDLLDPKHFKTFGTSPLWLYLWLLDKMTSISENGVGKVLGGKPIKYDDITKELGISKTTARRWLYMLRDNNYINTTQAPYGLVISVNKASKIFGKRVTKKEHPVAREGDQKRTPSVPKMDTLVTKNGHSNKTIQLDNTVDNTNTASSDAGEIGSLYFQVIKKLDLPVLNHNTIRGKIRELEKHPEPQKIIKYLIFLRDHYSDIVFEFKPSVDKALDIYDKRKQIENRFEDHINKPKGVVKIS